MTASKADYGKKQCDGNHRAGAADGVDLVVEGYSAPFGLWRIWLNRSTRAGVSFERFPDGHHSDVLLPVRALAVTVQFSSASITAIENKAQHAELEVDIYE